MKTASEALDAINELELRFPVAEWRAGDIDLWPAYRVRLYGNGLRAVLSNAASDGFVRRLLHLASRAGRALWRVPLARISDRTANATARAGIRAVFLSDGVSFVRLGRTWFDRVVDPVIEALQARGLQSLKLTPLTEAHVPRHMPSLFVQPTIDRIKLTASLRRTRLRTPEFDVFHAAARERFGDVVPSHDWLRLQAMRLEGLAAWFGRTLKSSGATHVFVNTYYSLEGLAFVQAARRLGLRSVDLQHGIQGPQHVAYARWATLPVRGYSTLPDEFWVWGQEELKAIDAWRSGRAMHLPVITGNFWLQHWRNDADPVVASYITQARSLRDPRPGVRQALVCLTWGVVPEETDKLIEVAKLCGGSVAWWWRMHPVLASQSADFARRLERHGLDGSHVRQITELPLYSILRVADLALAHSSTVVQEAAEFGVPSVVTSEYGADLLSGLVHRGSVLHATETRRIADLVLDLAARPRATDKTACHQQDSLQAVIDKEFLLRRPSPSRLEVAPA
jgi:hypothetical protein